MKCEVTIKIMLKIFKTTNYFAENLKFIEVYTSMPQPNLFEKVSVYQ